MPRAWRSIESTTTKRTKGVITRSIPGRKESPVKVNNRRTAVLTVLSWTPSAIEETIAAVGSVAAVAAGAGLVFVVSTSITRPLAELVAGVHALERGRRALEALRLDAVLELLDRPVRCGGRDRGEACKARWMLFDCVEKIVVGIARHHDGVGRLHLFHSRRRE